MSRAGRTAGASLAVAAALGALMTAGPAGATPPAALAPRVVTDGECNKDTPRLINATPPALTLLGAVRANTVATGKGVTVAVVDSGVDPTNTHFSGALVPGIDIADGKAPNGFGDTYGHGTAVAGEIAARRVSGSGVVGLAPDALIMPIRVYTQDNGGNATDGQIEPDADRIANGISQAAARGAKIINVSMSSTSNTAGLRGAIQFAKNKGALVVASAGNRAQSDDKSDDPRYPGAYSDVLSVAATDASGNVTDDSVHGAYVDVAAPGQNILTTYLGNGDCLLAGSGGDGSTATASSTSYATAYVSALAALIAQAHPDETPAQWRYRIEATALRFRPDQRNDYSGWGVIQPYEALTFVADGTAPGPTDPVRPTVSAPTAAEAQTIAAAVETTPDTRARDQTLWFALAAVVAMLGLALAALLRKDRTAKRSARRRRADDQAATGPPPTPSGVR